MAVDAAGDISLTGEFSGTLRIGNRVHTRDPARNAVYVAKLGGANGLPLWSRDFQSPTVSSDLDVTMDAAGNVFLAGSFYRSLEIDGTVLTTSQEPDIFLTKLEGGTGLALWSRSSPQAFTVDFSPLLHVDRAGNVLMVSLIAVGSTFRLTKFDGAGQLLWSRYHERAYGGRMEHQGLRLNLDGAGNLLLSGSYVTLGRYSASGAFLAWFNAEGGFLSEKAYRPTFGRFGPVGGASGSGAAIDLAGNVVLGGYFGGTMDFGSGPLQACSNSPFVLKLDPTP